MNIKTYINLILRRINKLKNKKKLKNIVLTRISCLGRDIINLRYSDYRHINKSNVQKGRLDMLLEWSEKKEKRPKSKIVKKHLSRKDIFPLVKEQENNDWTNINDIEFLLIDSYSELTDQKFTHKKEGWSFLAHYSDINHSEEFKNNFSCEGLLPIEEIEKTYNDFFSWFELKYPHKEVLFIHFSTKFDTRIIFKERSKKILEVMKDLSSSKKFIKNIVVEDEKVFQNNGEKFPYHFSNDTFLEYVNNWKKYD